MTKVKKVFVKTYGCQMNAYDSSRMVDVMGGEGYAPTDTATEADLIILNTCHIREKAAEKLYSDIGRLVKAKRKRGAVVADSEMMPEMMPEMMIAVGGCVGQAEGAEIMRRAPVVDMVFGPQTYHRLPEMVRRAAADRAALGHARVLDTEFPAQDKFAALPAQQSGGAAASFLTIQEGCDKFCTFCVVPYTRGAEFSRAVATIENEARRLVGQGVKEITLLGQNVNAYHGAFEGGATLGLAGLIRRLAEIDGLTRIRYTTSHPRDMDDDLIAVHGEVPQCMPYMHLPVQSGSDRILAAMNRKHTAAHYMGIIERLRRARPDIALSSDFIVGFPGETEADFAATMKLLREVGYAQAYSFKYSPRPGTPAAEMEGQVPEAVKAARLEELQAEITRQQHAFNEATVGRKMDVLFERAGRQPGQLVGRSPYMQAVDADFGDAAQAASLLNSVVSVTIKAAGLRGLRAGIGFAGSAQPQDSRG